MKFQWHLLVLGIGIGLNIGGFVAAVTPLRKYQIDNAKILCEHNGGVYEIEPKRTLTKLKVTCVNGAVFIVKDRL